MTVDATILIAEIQRAGGDVRLVGCDRLKLVAPITLLPELADRVRAAKPMLLAALAGTDRKSNTAHEVGGGVLNPSKNSATAQHPTAASPSDRIASIPAHWRLRYFEALAYWSAFYPVGEAARLAWGEIENRWHMRYGERVPDWQCAGCRESIGGLAALTLADGNRVHLDKLGCLLSFGERWRRDAAAALGVLGLAPPPESDPFLIADGSG
jgi:hypothetical protein